MSETVLSILNGSGMIPSLNSTFIALIPKLNAPTFVSDFRLISLCNVLYKIVSKVITNRLKHIIPMIISDNQSTFISGRSITDNILLAHELLHSMQRGRRGKLGRMALKLDMSKAYDKVEWEYLKVVLKRLGFHDHWVKLVMSCVTSVTYSALVNGKPGLLVTPTRGLRQGNPLSPYIFLLCAEGLSSMLNQVERRG